MIPKFQIGQKIFEIIKEDGLLIPRAIKIEQIKITQTNVGYSEQYCEWLPESNAFATFEEASAYCINTLIERLEIIKKKLMEPKNE